MRYCEAVPGAVPRIMCQVAPANARTDTLCLLTFAKRGGGLLGTRTR